MFISLGSWHVGPWLRQIWSSAAVPPMRAKPSASGVAQQTRRLTALMFTRFGLVFGELESPARIAASTSRPCFAMILVVVKFLIPRCRPASHEHTNRSKKTPHPLHIQSRLPWSGHRGAAQPYLRERVL